MSSHDINFNWLPKGICFCGPGGQRVSAYVVPTRGAAGKMGIVLANKPVAQAVASIPLPAFYETDVDEYEIKIYHGLCENAPQLPAALRYLRASGAVITEVHGLLVSPALPKTPTDGLIVEAEVRDHVRNLVAAMTGLGQAGHAYRTENRGRLLRAVAPAEAQGTAPRSDSRGELRFHVDNADRPLPCGRDAHPGGRGKANAVQAFVAVRPKPPQMEVTAIDDVIYELNRRGERRLLDALQQPHFAVKRPLSHGGGLGVEQVPLLIRDDDGSWHSRFNAATVVGLTPAAQAAFDAFSTEVETSHAVNALRAVSGSVIIYSNTRCLHRRAEFPATFEGDDRFYIRLYTLPREALVAERFREGRVFQ